MPFKPLVKALDEKYQELPVQITEIQHGQYECCFSPCGLGRYYFLISVCGVAIPGSPFVVSFQLILYQDKKVLIFEFSLGKVVLIFLTLLVSGLFRSLSYAGNSPKNE